jgi:hypothetical protein
MLIADNVDSTHCTRARMQFVNQLDHPSFVRHRYEQAVEIAHPPNAGNERIQSIGWHLHGNADRVSSLRREQWIKELW